MLSIIKRYIPFLQDYKLKYIFILIGIVLSVIATAGTAYIMKPMMDDMFINKDEKMIYIIPVSLVILYIIKSVGRYIQSVYMAYIGTHIISRLRELLLEKVIKLDMEFLYINRSGELISRITNDVNRVQMFVSNLLPELIKESLSVVSLIGYVIYLNYKLAFIALIVVPIVLYPLYAVAKKLKKYSHRSQEKSADIISKLSEIFNNVEIIKSYSTETDEVKKFDKENWKFFKINMKSVYVGELVSPFLEIFGAFALGVIIYVGGSEVYEGKMSVGEFMAFLTAVGLVFKPFRNLGQIYSKIQDAIAASERIFDIVDRESKIKDGNIDLDEEIKTIEFRDIVLEYEGKNLLDGVSFSVEKGEFVGLIGDSGGGKSTVLQLLLRYYEPKSGEILINNKNIKNFTLKSLTQHISYVTQNIYILNDTILANVAYGDENPDEERVIEALKKANIYDFVKTLKDGIYTILDEKGSNLSGGQRQRISLARAIYKGADLLLLDEATSALDNESETKVQKSLEELYHDKIIIAIAHRLSTLKNASKIVELRKGKVKNIGSYKEVVKNNL